MLGSRAEYAACRAVGSRGSLARGGRWTGAPGHGRRWEKLRVGKGWVCFLPRRGTK